MNKKFVYQVGNNKKLYCDAWPTKYQEFQYTILTFLSYLAQFFLELEMFQTKVVEEIKRSILCSIFFRKSCCLWENVENGYRAGAGHRRNYGACALHDRLL